MRAIVLASLALVAMTAAAATVPRTANQEENLKLMQQVMTKSFASTRKGVDDPEKRIIIENFFTTRVDHFNAQNTAEWTLRYFAVTDYYIPGGPILIFLGGTSPIVTSMVDESTLIYEMARELNGAVYAFESRFYGQSIITEDVSTENLSLLNVDQILADLAEFVRYLKVEVLKNEYAKVLVSGSELGGGLATWFRVRYPHLADAAWSSSGHHHAVMDFQEFSEAWGQTLIDYGSQECYNDIFVAFHVMQNLIDIGLANILYDKFNICSQVDPENRLQVMYFFSVMMTAVEIYTLRNGDLDDFADVCQDITSPQFSTSLDAFAYWFNTKFAEDIGCVVVDVDTMVEAFSETEWDAAFNALGARQALYQMCNEFGWFFTTDSDFQPFGSRVYLELYSETCRKVFGDWITFESIYYATVRANNRFGASAPVITNVHYTNGAEDPWRMIGITTDRNAYALADVIPRELSSADLPATSENDSEELLEVKRRVKSLISYYLYPATPREAPKSDDTVV
ncbi:putative serine protease K12H4.7 [Armigeres subalbatus]|uniref:putative serine protease K12H4.7 n=1 Tax=Armigeres subalbatus TaxID=124917 RepID=UPI002ED1E9B5